MERFFEKTEPEPTSGCLLWTARRQPTGYGTFDINSRRWRAHRVAWVLEHGDIPDGLHVLHRCDNPPCVNVEHLFLGTQADNMADMIAKGRYVGPPRTISDEAAADIRAATGTLGEIAAAFGVSYRTVARIRNGEGRWNSEVS